MPPSVLLYSAAAAFVGRNEVVGVPVAFRAARSPRGGGHREGETVEALQQVVDHRGLARSGGRRYDDNFSHQFFCICDLQI